MRENKEYTEHLYSEMLPMRERERERKKERKKERKREREREREREIYQILLS